MAALLLFRFAILTVYSVSGNQRCSFWVRFFENVFSRRAGKRSPEIVKIQKKNGFD